jgi:hypothetical protein
MTFQEAMELIHREDPKYFEHMGESMEKSTAETGTVVLIAGPKPFGIVGSKRAECMTCAAKLWLSPWSLEMLEKRGDRRTIILCESCGTKLQRMMDEGR